MTHIPTGVCAMSVAVRLCLASVAAAVAGAATAAPTTTRVIVAYKAGTVAKVKTLIGAAKGSIKHEISDTNAMAVDMPSAAIAGLSRNPNIEYVEVDLKRYPSALTAPSAAPYLSGQLVPYGIPMVQADKLSDVHAGNRMVCIIDSGYSIGQEDLAANTVTGENDKENRAPACGQSTTTTTAPMWRAPSPRSTTPVAAWSG